MMICFGFFKQKTAYEVRISDWSSDVCSSDLSGSSSEGRGHKFESCRVHHSFKIIRAGKRFAEFANSPDIAMVDFGAWGQKTALPAGISPVSDALKVSTG